MSSRSVGAGARPSSDFRAPLRSLSSAELSTIVDAASTRFLTANEVYRLLHSFRRHGLHHPGSACGGLRTEPAHLPESGSWFLFAPGARLRGDGHAFAKRVHKGFLITREQHVRLSVVKPDNGTFAAMRGYYSATEGDGPALVRRIVWLLDSEWDALSTPAPESAVRRGGIGGGADFDALQKMRKSHAPVNDGRLDPAVRGVAFVHYLTVPEHARPAGAHTPASASGGAAGESIRRSSRNAPSQAAPPPRLDLSAARARSAALESSAVVALAAVAQAVVAQAAAGEGGADVGGGAGAGGDAGAGAGGSARARGATAGDNVPKVSRGVGPGPGGGYLATVAPVPRLEIFGGPVDGGGEGAQTRRRRRESGHVAVVGDDAGDGDDDGSARTKRAALGPFFAGAGGALPHPLSITPLPFFADADSRSVGVCSWGAGFDGVGASGDGMGSHAGAGTGAGAGGGSGSGSGGGAWSVLKDMPLDEVCSVMDDVCSLNDGGGGSAGARDDARDDARDNARDDARDDAPPFADEDMSVTSDEGDDECGGGADGGADGGAGGAWRAPAAPTAAALEARTRQLLSEFSQQLHKVGRPAAPAAKSVKSPAGSPAGVACPAAPPMDGGAGVGAGAGASAVTSLARVADGASGRTLLHLAAADGSAALCASLLAAGALADAADAAGVTPRALAAAHAPLAALFARAPRLGAPAAADGSVPDVTADGAATVAAALKAALASYGRTAERFRVVLSPADRAALIASFDSLKLRDKIAVSWVLANCIPAHAPAGGTRASPAATPSSPASAAAAAARSAAPASAFASPLPAAPRAYSVTPSPGPSKSADDADAAAAASVASATTGSARARGRAGDGHFDSDADAAEEMVSTFGAAESTNLAQALSLMPLSEVLECEAQARRIQSGARMWLARLSYKRVRSATVALQDALRRRRAERGHSSSASGGGAGGVPRVSSAGDLPSARGLGMTPERGGDDGGSAAHKAEARGSAGSTRDESKHVLWAAERAAAAERIVRSIERFWPIAKE
jgi:hypothetical protein